MSNIVFKEEQPFYTQPLTWIVWVVFLIMVLWMYQQGMLLEGVGLLIMIVVAAVIVLVLFTGLDTRISQDGVDYRMRPFHKTYRHIEWNDVAHAEVRKYSPIREFGGWGIRIGLKGKAYNVKGNMGLQLELKDGRRILIGTQKPEELREVLKSVGVL